MTRDARLAAARTVVAIRNARLADAPVILALQRAAYRSVAAQYDAPDLPPLTESMDDVRAAFATHTIIVAEHHSAHGGSPALVGSARARTVGAVAHIGRLWVRPGLHGRGIGRQLLEAIERRVAPVARYELFTGHRSDRALRMYERAGYRPTHTVRESATVSLTFLVKTATPPADR